MPFYNNTFSIIRFVYRWTQQKNRGARQRQQRGAVSW